MPVFSRAHEGLQRAVMKTAQWQLPDERIHRHQRSRMLRLCWFSSRYFVAASRIVCF
jgi:hypothetical protein